MDCTHNGNAWDIGTVHNERRVLERKGWIFSMRSVGDKVKMTEDAIENYGEEYDGVIFVITHVATRYMPAKEFYNKGMPDGYHPGYDTGINEPLYDLDIDGEGREFCSSLYEYELIPQF